MKAPLHSLASPSEGPLSLTGPLSLPWMQAAGAVLPAGCIAQVSVSALISKFGLIAFSRFCVLFLGCGCRLPVLRCQLAAGHCVPHHPVGWARVVFGRTHGMVSTYLYSVYPCTVDTLIQYVPLYSVRLLFQARPLLFSVLQIPFF